MKRYILTAIDPVTHVAFAYAQLGSARFHAASFHRAIGDAFPPLANANVLTDNGSKFKGAFTNLLASNASTHWRTYPKTPKMNAHCERFNRSIQESFVDYFEDLLFSDHTLFINNWPTGWSSTPPLCPTSPTNLSPANQPLYPTSL